MSSAQVDEAWRALLEETLPADKREALQESYDAETDPQTRYNMLLEFSSYLRQVSHRAPAQALSLCKSTQSGLTTHPCHPCLECSQTATNHTMGGGDGSEDPYAVPRRGGVDAPPGFGRPREIYDDDDTSLCWEIVRVLLIVGAILGAVIGGAWWLSKSLEAGSPEALTINDGRELQDSEHE